MSPVLCLVTDRRRAATTDALVRRVAIAAGAGVHLVQVREPDLDTRALLDLVKRLVAAVRGSRTRVVVNDRLDVALAAGAHGAHLPGSSLPAARARALAPPGFLLGRSVHATDEAAGACAGGGLDYLVFGTVFATGSKPEGRAAGAAALEEAVAVAAGVPVLGIGGVTVARAGAIARTGSVGLAAIGLFADPVETELPEALAAVRAAWENEAHLGRRSSHAASRLLPPR